MTPELELALDITFYILSTLLGLAVGSFLNVCIYRLPRGNFFSKARSFCPKCGTPIKAYDNIPLLSYIILRGKCRACHEPISPRYPLIEALNMILWIVNYAVFGMQYITIVYDILVSTLIVVAMIDIDMTEIPDSSILTILILGLLTFIPVFDMSWQSKLIGSFCISVPMLIIALFGGMGFGDVKLYFVLGLLFGWEKTLILFVLSMVIGSVGGIANLIYVRRKNQAIESTNDDEAIVDTESANTPYIANGTPNTDMCENCARNGEITPKNITNNVNIANSLEDTSTANIDNTSCIQCSSECETHCDSKASVDSVSDGTPSSTVSGKSDEDATYLARTTRALDYIGDSESEKAPSTSDNIITDENTVLPSDASLDTDDTASVKILTINNSCENAKDDMSDEDAEYERQLQEKLDSGRALPFGPFIVLATFITMYAGDAIIGFYKGLIGM